jgi:hypothetical protein
MKTLKTRFNYEANVIMPRKRKPECVNLIGYVNVNIAEASSDNFLPAFRVGSEVYYWSDVTQKLYKQLKLNHKSSDCLSFDTLALYVANDVSHYNGNPLGCSYFEKDKQSKESLGYRDWVSDNEQVMAQSKISKADDLIVFEEMIYSVAPEPVYKFMTFGMNNNHGGTGVFVDSYSKNCSGRSFYSALEYDEFIKAATSVAINRGDTNSLPLESKLDNKIEVLLPKAVKFSRKQALIEDGYGVLSVYNDNGDELAWFDVSKYIERKATNRQLWNLSVYGFEGNNEDLIEFAKGAIGDALQSFGLDFDYEGKLKVDGFYKELKFSRRKLYDLIIDDMSIEEYSRLIESSN